MTCGQDSRPFSKRSISSPLLSKIITILPNEQALRREVEAKRAVEKQVQGYKDMNETLHEALSIAANNAAEHQLLDGDGEAFLKDLEGDDAQGASAGDGNKGGAKAQAAAAQKFVVSADGSYKKQGQE